jgi:hypothetical protein
MREIQAAGKLCVEDRHGEAEQRKSVDEISSADSSHSLL